jgi:hypothetical protein
MATVWLDHEKVEMDIEHVFPGFRGVFNGIGLFHGRRYHLQYTGKKFYTSGGTEPWKALWEIKYFKPLRYKNEYGDEDYDIKGIVRDFICSQFRDGEKISTEIVKDLLFHAKPAYGNERKYHEFHRISRINYLLSDYGGQWNSTLQKIAEEVLIDLFCSTENESRVLTENNGVFMWIRR